MDIDHECTLKCFHEVLTKYNECKEHSKQYYALIIVFLLFKSQRTILHRPTFKMR